MEASTDDAGREPRGEAGDKQRGRRRRLVLPIALVVLVIGLVWGVHEVRYRLSHESTDDAYVTGHLVPVLAHVGGYVADVPVAENEHVREGAPLVAIDDTELRQALKEAQARLEEARAATGVKKTTGTAQAQVEEARSRIQSLEAQLEGARVRLETARKDLQRTQDLAQNQVVSQQQVDAAQATVASDQAQVHSLEKQRAAAQAALTGARAGLGAAQARLDAAQAAVERAELQLSYAHITAPAAGIVSKRSVETGQLLQPGQPVMSIVADTGVVVTANFKETQLSEIRPGQSVQIEVDAYGGCQAEGTVESLGGATGSQFSLLPPENATGNFTKVVQRVPVRIRITKECGEDQPLRPGLSTVVHVSTN